jgi:cell pole-organizing protein PopZ
MTQPAKLQEPSMEEILASIRRILADDDASKAARRPAEPPMPAAAPAPPQSSARFGHAAPERLADQPAIGRASLEEQASDILDFTESMAPSSFARPESAMPSPMPPTPSPAPQFRKIEGVSDASFDKTEAKPAMPSTIAETPSLYAEREQLLSSAASAAVDSAFGTLAQTVLAQNARTLEDLVGEMLRPMLKSWLDDNLPGLVERLVRAEIERIARAR